MQKKKRERKGLKSLLLLFLTCLSSVSVNDKERIYRGSIKLYVHENKKESFFFSSWELLPTSCRFLHINIGVCLFHPRSSIYCDVLAQIQFIRLFQRNVTGALTVVKFYARYGYWIVFYEFYFSKNNVPIKERAKTFYFRIHQLMILKNI